MPCYWKRLFSRDSQSLTPQILHEPIEEEADYSERLKHFHPTQPGEILDNRFKTVGKLGYGRGSTVWLAENLNYKIWSRSKIPRYVSIKITASDVEDAQERAWLTRISEADPSHQGLSHIRTPIDAFEMKGALGTHSCLVFEPMRETLWRFQQRWPRQRLPLDAIKLHMLYLLKALDYLHTECRLIHTDIKDDNVMITIEHDSVLKRLVDYFKMPQPRHIRDEDGRVTYLSVDGMEDNALFERPAGDDDVYDAHVHLAQMISILGDPPQALVERERRFRDFKIGSTIVNERGEKCSTMNEFWGGPFFDDDGCMIRKELIKERRDLSDTVTEITGDEKERFLDFAASMLQWLPENRKTAKELSQHPFLSHGLK
ncbi:probable dis1-suppressing protein kinase dsk1 [Claviceps purpurea 20.1]|uniref:non-specific serine/threonine protein kinase n=1 Tax=Claviceps purpurea (strain 20.1) TaxID=1111077 RepID=M1VW32_CLAP2|nr:probable dis1-suppressing protein kinase dsk1 [Claviceps purpurea 20.1]